MITIYTGDDISLAIRLKQNGSSFLISPTATVRAALVQDNTITGPVTCSPDAEGADWEQSLVAIEFESIVSANAPVGRNKLEIEVDDSGKTTFVVQHILVVKDSI